MKLSECGVACWHRPKAARRPWGAQTGRRRRRLPPTAHALPAQPPAALLPWPAPVMSDYHVELVEDNISEFHVVFKGPPDSAVAAVAAAAGCPQCRRFRLPACRPPALSFPHLLLLAIPSTPRQARTRAATGGCMWSCPRPTRTRARPSGLSTRSTTPTSTRWVAASCSLGWPRHLFACGCWASCGKGCGLGVRDAPPRAQHMHTHSRPLCALPPRQGAGSVCLDVINQTWSPMFDLVNVFETFLPQVGAGAGVGRAAAAGAGATGCVAWCALGCPHMLRRQQRR